MIGLAAIDEVIELLGRLPGVGERTATRYALHLLTQSADTATSLGLALQSLHSRVSHCQRCGHFAEADLCQICEDPRRHDDTLCVVARVPDLLAIERGGYYRGRYFVLHRLIAPLDGVGPDALPIEALRARIQQSGVQEVILATPLSVDGEATALFIQEAVSGLVPRVTRIATGIPQGGELEYTDHLTLERAMGARRPLEQG